MALLDLLGIDSSTGQMRRYKTDDTVNGAGDMFLDRTQSITGAKTFGASTLKVAGSTSGTLTLNAAAVAGDNTITLPALTGTVLLDTTTSIAGASWILDEDNMASDSATQIPTQQSVKAYVDAGIAAINPPVDTVNGMTGAVTLDTDDIGEGASNQYFTDERAKSAAVVNSTAGSETDQAPSVSAMKSYADTAASNAVAAIDYPVDSVNGYTDIVNLNTDDIGEGVSNLYYSDVRAKSAAVVDDMSGSEIDQAPSVNSVKMYVSNTIDTAVAGLLDYKGAYDATSGSLETPAAGTVKKGDTYTATVAGSFYASSLEVGDVIIAKQDDPSLLDHWTIAQKNLLSPLNAATVTLADETSDAQNFLAFSKDATGAMELKTNSSLTFDATSGVLSAGGLSAGDINLSDGSALQTGTANGDTVELKAYDVDGSSYTTFATLTAGDTPTMDLASSVTSGNEQIQTPSNSATLSNKTISGNSNTLSDIGVSSLANGTDGALITWDTDGVATTLNPGDATKALVSNGAGAMPSYQTVELLLSSTPDIDGVIVAGPSLPATPSAPTFTGTLRTCGTSGDYATLSAAITASSAGDRIQILAGTITEASSVTVNKSLEIFGTGNTCIVRRDATSAVITITAADVYIHDFSVRNFTTASADAGGLSSCITAATMTRNQTSGLSGIRIENMSFTYPKMGVSISGASFVIKGCTFTANASPMSTTNRVIALYGSSGTSYVVDNTINASSDGNRTQAIFISGTNDGQVPAWRTGYTGSLVIKSNVIVNNPAQYLNMEWWADPAFASASVPSGGFNMYLDSNDFSPNYSAAPVSFYNASGSINPLTFFGTLWVSGNIGGERAASTNEKGFIGIDGTGSSRSIGAPVTGLYVSVANTVASDLPGTSYNNASTIDNLIGYNSAVYAAPGSLLAPSAGSSPSTYNLYTVPAGKTAIITRAVLKLTAASAVTGVGSFGIGVASGEEDIFASMELTGVTSTNNLYMYSNVMGKFRSAAATEVIKLGIDTGYTATTATFTVDLFGYLV